MASLTTTNKDSIAKINKKVETLNTDIRKVDGRGGRLAQLENFMKGFTHTANGQVANHQILKGVLYDTQGRPISTDEIHNTVEYFKKIGVFSKVLIPSWGKFFLQEVTDRKNWSGILLGANCVSGSLGSIVNAIGSTKAAAIVSAIAGKYIGVALPAACVTYALPTMFVLSFFGDMFYKCYQNSTKDRNGHALDSYTKYKNNLSNEAAVIRTIPELKNEDAPNVSTSISAKSETVISFNEYKKTLWSIGYVRYSLMKHLKDSAAQLPVPALMTILGLGALKGLAL